MEEKTAPVVKNYNQSKFGNSWGPYTEAPAAASESSVSMERETVKTKDGNRNDLKRLHQSSHYSHDCNWKKQKLASRSGFSWGQCILGSELEETTSGTGLDSLLKLVIDAYFVNVHPWIPMIHEATFRDLISKETHALESEGILHAMLVAGLGFIESKIKTSINHMVQLLHRSRNWVILNATSGMSVRNLQALIIIAFNDVSKLCSLLIHG